MFQIIFQYQLLRIQIPAIICSRGGGLVGRILARPNGFQGQRMGGGVMSSQYSVTGQLHGTDYQ